MNILIRPMMLEDLTSVMKINPLCFGTDHWSRNSFTLELNNTSSSYFTARAPQGTGYEVLGYTGFWKVLDEAHLTTLAVNPAYRRLQIGEKLLYHALKAAYELEAQWMTLEVRASNEPAKMLYQKYGFRECGNRPRYYRDNEEDALILWTGNIRSDPFQQMLADNQKSLSMRALVTASAQCAGAMLSGAPGPITHGKAFAPLEVHQTNR